MEPKRRWPLELRLALIVLVPVLGDLVRIMIWAARSGREVLDFAKQLLLRYRFDTGPPLSASARELIAALLVIGASWALLFLSKQTREAAQLILTGAVFFLLAGTGVGLVVDLLMPADTFPTLFVGLFPRPLFHGCG